MLASNNVTTNLEYKTSPSSDIEMESRQENLKLHIPPSSIPTRNTIRTSPNAHITQEIVHSKGERNYVNVFSFMDDCNIQGNVNKC